MLGLKRKRVTEGKAKSKKAEKKPKPKRPETVNRDRNLRHTNNGTLINEENVLHISYSNLAHKDEGSSDLQGLFAKFKSILLENKELEDPFCSILEAELVRKLLLKKEEDLTIVEWPQINRCFLKFVWLRLYSTTHLCYNEAQLRLWYDTKARCKRTVILPALLRHQVWQGAGKAKRNYWTWLIAMHPLTHFLSLDAVRRAAKRNKRQSEILQQKVSASKVKAHYGNCPALFFSTASEKRPDWVDGYLQLPWNEYQKRVMEKLLIELRPSMMTDNSTRASGIISTDENAIIQQKPRGRRPAKPQERGDERAEMDREKYLRRRESKKYGAQTGTAHFRMDTAMTLPFLFRREEKIELQRDCLLNDENVLTNWIQSPMEWINPDEYLLPQPMTKKLANSMQHYSDELFIVQKPFGLQTLDSWSSFKESGLLHQLNMQVDWELKSEAEDARFDESFNFSVHGLNDNPPSLIHAPPPQDYPVLYSPEREVDFEPGSLAI